MKLATKARIRHTAVSLLDLLKLTRFARPRHKSPIEMPFRLSLSQPFKPSSTLEGKKHNLREAASRINAVIVAPGETFSFWHCVGNPNNPRRFTEGRSIHAGVTTRDFGGGLCQASGIIHHMALLAGLKITERFNHSVDLYTDETRFAPLGTDATVFYGFKDLRIINTLSFPIRFILEVNDDNLTLHMTSPEAITPISLHINVDTTADGHKNVTITDADSGTPLSQSTYLPLN